MGATQLWMSHMMPPSPGMEPGQQKVMRWMPLMMIAFFYRMSAGLTLYWTVQNLLSIVQLKLTKTNDNPVPPATATAPVPVKKKK
jgi:YidC/Oxa1 family membrane protein insertase